MSGIGKRIEKLETTAGGNGRFHVATGRRGEDSVAAIQRYQEENKIQSFGGRDIVFVATERVLPDKNAVTLN